MHIIHSGIVRLRCQTSKLLKVINEAAFYGHRARTSLALCLTNPEARLPISQA